MMRLPPKTGGRRGVSIHIYIAGTGVRFRSREAGGLEWGSRLERGYDPVPWEGYTSCPFICTGLHVQLGRIVDSEGGGVNLKLA